MTIHARLGASSSDRWLNCTISPGLIDDLQAERKSSVYAAEGTVAHEIAANILINGELPDEYAPGMTVHVEGHDIVVDDKMIEHVITYVRECEDIIGNCSGSMADAHIEATFSLDPLWLDLHEVPPESLFGTADFAYFSKPGLTLYVRDLKFGKGVGVEAKGNTQLMYYALAAFLALPHEEQTFVDWIDAGIVQPRYSHPDGPVRTLTIHKHDLLDWGQSVIRKTVDDIHAEKVRFKSGKWCRWCPVAGSCAHLANKAQTTAKKQFGSLDNAEMGEVLDELDTIQNWVNQVRSEAMHRIDSGATIPGWKLVPKRAIRKWTDNYAAAKALKQAGLHAKDFMDAKMRSPAAVERIVDPEVFKKLGDLIDKSSSGSTLAPDEDSREAVPPAPTAGEVFSQDDHALDEAEISALEKL